MCQLDTALTGVPLTLTFDLEFSRSNCISGMGGPIAMERKGRESIGCPDVKHKEISQLDAALTGVPLTLTFDLEFSRSNCISGMGGPIITPTMWPWGRGYCQGPGWLKMVAFPSTRLIPCILPGCFIGTGAILWLPHCQWSNLEEYGWNQLESKYNKKCWSCT